jgi:hypothetical protein
MNTSGLMAALLAMGQQPQNQQQIPPQQVMPQSPQGGMPQMPGVPQAQPQGGGGMGSSPMLQMAMQQMSNPMSQTIPQAPQAVPPNSAHPILQRILQGLGGGLQGMGYGMMRSDQQMESQQLAAKKAETMANIASTQAWREQMGGVAQQKANTMEERAKTAEEQAQTQKEKVRAYEELGNQRNAIMKAKSDWEKDLGQGNYQVALQKMLNQASQFQQSIEQKKDLFEQSQSLKAEALESSNFFKQGAQDILKTALSQKGTIGAAEIMQKVQGTGLEHWFQNAIGSVDSGQSLIQQGQGAGVPGVGAPTGGAGSAPPTGQPPLPTTENKARAKGGAAPKPKGKVLVEGRDF